MSLFVNTNVSSLNAQRQIFDVSNSLSTSFERLSSGFRINSAADDAAGLQISERMTSQIQGLDQAVRNANDAISVVQTAEGALDETTTALQRIRTLSVQAQNGINSPADIKALSSEIGQLKEEIDRIARDTDFAGKQLLDGNFSADFLVGANATQTVTVTIGRNFNTDAANLNIQDTLDTNPGGLLGQVDAALSAIGTQRAELGAYQNRFQSTIRNLSNISENVSAARSRIQDTDFATETANLTRNQIMQQASTTVLAQANQRPQAALSLLGG
tara:strand:+ start:198 stop:1016 length:819 start_codon:yes stop_codon:yes gene_type:complete